VTHRALRRDIGSYSREVQKGRTAWSTALPETDGMLRFKRVVSANPTFEEVAEHSRPKRFRRDAEYQHRVLTDQVTSCIANAVPKPLATWRVERTR